MRSLGFRSLGNLDSEKGPTVSVSRSFIGEYLAMRPSAPVHQSARNRAGSRPITQSPGVDQAAVTLGNTDGEIGGLTISDPPSQAEVQALRDQCEELGDDVRALSTLVHAMRGALVAVVVVKGGP